MNRISRENRLCSCRGILGMMKITPLLGTAQGLKGFELPQPVAPNGNDERNDDAVCRSHPQILTVVWVGFDHNKSVGTGAGWHFRCSGEYQKRIAPLLSTDDFKWPEGTRIKKHRFEGPRQDLSLPRSRTLRSRHNRFGV